MPLEKKKVLFYTITVWIKWWYKRVFCISTNNLIVVPSEIKNLLNNHKNRLDSYDIKRFENINLDNFTSDKAVDLLKCLQDILCLSYNRVEVYGINLNESILKLILDTYNIEGENLVGEDIGLMFAVLWHSLLFKETEKVSQEMVKNLLNFVIKIKRSNVDLKCVYGSLSYYVKCYIRDVMYVTLKRQNLNGFDATSMLDAI